MWQGVPIWETQWKSRALAQLEAQEQVRGTASGHRVHLSTVVKRKEKPLETGMGLTRSTCIWENGFSGTSCAAPESGGERPCWFDIGETYTKLRSPCIGCATQTSRPPLPWGMNTTMRDVMQDVENLTVHRRWHDQLQGEGGGEPVEMLQRSGVELGWRWTTMSFRPDMAVLYAWMSGETDCSWLSSVTSTPREIEGTTQWERAS